MRNRFAAAAVVLAAALLPLTAVPPAVGAPLGEDTLDVEPAATVSGGTVTVTGSCAQEFDGDGFSFPSSTELSLSGTTVSRTVKIGGEGAFAETVSGPLPQGLPSGPTSFVTSCGGTADFTVLEAPFLALTPPEGEPGTEVALTGTCPLEPRATPPSIVDIALGDLATWATMPLDASTGVLAPTPATIPEDLPPGEYEVVSSCGYRTPLAVLEPTTQTPTETTTTATDSPTSSTEPTETTGPATLVVPNLIDLSEEEAREVMGESLTLDVIGGGSGPIESQDPPPGTVVEVGTVVAVELGPPPSPDPASTSWWWLLLGGLAAVVLVGALAALVTRTTGWRERRERRWVRRPDTVGLKARLPGLSFAPGHDVVVPSWDAELEVRLEPAELELQEVGHARD